MNERRNGLRKILKRVVRRGESHTLSSGKISDIYVDVRKVALDGRGARLIGEALCHLTLEASTGPLPQAVAGVELGGIPLATAVSLIADGRGWSLPVVAIRKTPKGYGTNRRLEIAETVPKRASVVLVDDVLTTGGTLLKIGVPALEEAGFTIAKILTVVDRQENEAREKIIEAGYSFNTIFTLAELL